MLLATNFLPPATASGGVVLVVHDLAFRRFPETAPHMDVRWVRRFESWLGKAARVIVPSRSAKDDLEQLFGVEPERVDVIHHGVDAHAFRPAPGPVVADVRRRFEIAGPFALFVGGIEPRKNLEQLVHAFARLKEDDAASLVIAGGPVRSFPKRSSISTPRSSLPAGVRSRVIRTGYVANRTRSRS